MKQYSVAKFLSHCRKTFTLFPEPKLLNETAFFETKDDAIEYLNRMKSIKPNYLWALSEYQLEHDKILEEVISHQYIFGTP